MNPVVKAALDPIRLAEELREAEESCSLLRTENSLLRAKIADLTSIITQRRTNTYGASR